MSCVTAYAIDDDTAIKVIDGAVGVVSKGTGSCSTPDFVGGHLRCWEVTGCAGYLVGGNGKRRMSAASASGLTTMRSRNEATAPTVAAIMAGDWSNSWPRRA
jgi:hypothetical protein